MGNSIKRIMLALILIAMAGLNAPPLAASDISPYETGARALGLGGAFAARADDPTALFANPAGLAFQKGFRFKTSFFFGKLGVRTGQPSGNTALRSDPLQFRGSFAASWQFREGMSASVGFFIPYRFSTAWPFLWAGDQTAVKATLTSIFIRPAVSIELLDNLALGVGLDIVPAKASWVHILTFNMEKYPLPEDARTESNHQLSGTGMGFTAGLLWKAHPMIRFGLKYQHPVPVNLSGSNTFLIRWDSYDILLPDPVDPWRRLHTLLKDFYSNQPVKSRMTFPREIVCGVAFVPSARWSLELEVQRNDWSESGPWEFRSVNPDDSLSPEFTPQLQEFYGVAPDYGTQGAGLVLKDTWRIKTGLEFVPAAGFALRAGYARHQSPMSATGLNLLNPCLDRDIVSLGVGYEGAFFSMGSDQKLGEISLDVFFQYGFSKKGALALPGYELIYQDQPWSLGISVGAII